MIPSLLIDECLPTNLQAATALSNTTAIQELFTRTLETVRLLIPQVLDLVAHIHI